MAKVIWKDNEILINQIKKLGDNAEPIFKKAVYVGTGIVAKKIRENLDALPTEKFRKLQKGEQFDGVPENQKKDMIEGYGITKITKDKDGYIGAKIGFTGYGKTPTKKYPKGLPNALVARSIESGSSVRKKHRFVAPAVNATKAKALKAMEQVVEDEIKKITEAK